MPPVDKYICIHGHFYQPPRENPWLEEIEVQESARPFHDWNEKISHECYGPNAHARILDDLGRLVDIVNNYEFISFDFGPTLLTWMEKHARDVYDHILEADAASVKARSGHGNAIAQAYNHMIMPLASRRDKITQIIWGIKDFRHRFRRDPEGIWLPETAVDKQTLEILVDNGIVFTILAQKQAAMFRAGGDPDWQDLRTKSIDPTKPYIYRLPTQKDIAIFFYDGPISQAIAFQGLLHSGEELKNRLLGAFSPTKTVPQLVHIATDGESYGHHHRFGEMALAYAVRALLDNASVRLTNYGEYLEQHPPTFEVEIYENSAWSCAHGVGRWSFDCGCRTNPRPDWNQQWREPLRRSLDYLRDEIDNIYESVTAPWLKDPWVARNHYVDLLLQDAPKIGPFLKQHQSRQPKKGTSQLLLRMLEMQRFRMYMFTSCGWFFDDLAGIETVQILRYAGKAIQIAKAYNRELESNFLSILEEARTNVKPVLSGAELFHLKVTPQISDLQKVAAHVAISSLFEEVPFREKFYCFNVNVLESIKERSGEKTLLIGRMIVLDRRTGESENLVFTVIHYGGVDLRCSVAEKMNNGHFTELKHDLVNTFRLKSSTELLRKLDSYFPGAYFSLGDLFVDQRRKIIDAVTHRMYEDQAEVFYDFYQNNKDIAGVIKSHEAKLPETFLAAAGFVINKTILSEVEKLSQGFYPDELQGIFDEALYWNIELDLTEASNLTANCIHKLMIDLQKNPGDMQKAKEILQFLDLANHLSVELDLSDAQITFFHIAEKFRKEKQRSMPTILRELADKLSVRINHNSRKG